MQITHKHIDGSNIQDNKSPSNVREYMNSRVVGGMGTVSLTKYNASEIVDSSLDEWFNLVVFGGREFSLGKITGQSSNGIDYSKYKLAYFGVGSGGADLADSSVKYGPYDNDTDLKDPKIISSEGINDSANSYKYMNGGKLKLINDVDATIVTQELTPNAATSEEEVPTDTYTKCTYILRIEQTEMTEAIFQFNEAGLYIMEYDTSGNPIDGTQKLFARFTTGTKDKEQSDTIQIEWSILT